MRVHTEAVQFKADSKLVLFIEEKLSKMTHFFDRIIEANVTLKLENSGQVKDKITEIRVLIPGHTLVAKSTDKSFEASCVAAIESLRRQLHKHKGKRLRRA